MKHAIQRLPRARRTDRESRDRDSHTFELWGARYEVPEIEPAIDEELGELRAAIAELQERIAGLRERTADLDARERAEEVAS